MQGVFYDVTDMDKADRLMEHGVGLPNPGATEIAAHEYYCQAWTILEGFTNEGGAGR